jgi:uncharacterized protein YxjI
VLQGNPYQFNPGETSPMHPSLANNLYLVKEHTGVFKAANNYDIHDPETGEIVLDCREEKLGMFTKILRFTDYKRMTPFHIEIRTPEGEIVVQVKRGVSIFLSKVQVLDGQGKVLGGFKQKFFSIGGAFKVLDPNDKPLCELKGKWTSWNFRFMAGDRQLAQVSKKWAGLGRELFTSADNYMLEIDPAIPADSAFRPLIMAAVMCIDMVLKE